ncbi:hypothetical protein [Rhodoferax antarcticus]|uniref:hypothetical protein n=1 Tax=Rhodoferax antarcticus TaxID=81479 RepID=UPI0022243215|nr:hypothetical protein [Rhodoferax antarcticus]MCW2313781.1 hypothetical protein [Rhodoferax antarcticus]
MRQLLTNPGDIAGIVHDQAAPLEQIKEMRADLYGIRTTLQVDGKPIKFEIVLEGRIQLATPTAEDEISGVATLSELDSPPPSCWPIQIAGADGVFKRDVIDLAMVKPKAVVWQRLRALRRSCEAVRQIAHLFTACHASGPNQPSYTYNPWVKPRTFLHRNHVQPARLPPMHS